MAALLSLILDCFAEKKQQKTMLEAAKAMVDASSTPIVLCDAKDGTIVHCNGAWSETCGYSIVEAFGRTNKELLQGPDTDCTTARELVRELRSTSSSRRVLKNYKKDGTPFWNQLFVAALRDINKRVVNYVGVQIPVAGPLPKPGQTEPMPYPAKAAPAPAPAA